MSGFTVVHMDHNSRQLGEAFPENLEFSLVFKEVGTISYELSTTHNMAKKDKVEPYVTDFLLLYNDDPIMGGIHTEIDKSDPESQSLKIAGKDWSHYLEKRFWPFDPASPVGLLKADTDLALIAKEMLDTVLAVPYSLGFNYVFNAVGNNVNFKIDPGDTQDMFRHFVDLSQLDPGFDFEFTWDRRIIMGPELGTHTGFDLVEGNNVEDMRYNNQGIRATKLLGQGSGGSGRLGKIAEDTTKQRQYRLLDDSADFGDIKSEEVLQQKTNTEFARRSIPLTVIGCNFVNQDVNVFDYIKPGDWAHVQANVDWDVIDDEFRVVGMRGSEDESGFVTVELTFDDGQTPL